MGFGGGVAEVGNAAGGDGYDAVTIPTVGSIEESAFVDGGRRGVHVDRGRGRAGMAERRDFEFGVGADGEGEDAAETGFKGAISGDID